MEISLPKSVFFFSFFHVGGGHWVRVSGHKARCACHNQSERSALNPRCLAFTADLSDSVGPVMSFRPQPWITCDAEGKTAEGLMGRLR